MHLKSPEGAELRAQLSTLVREHAARVRRVLARRGVAAADLPDAEQDVFIVAHRKLAEFEGRSSFATWLLGIASNVASQHRRLARHRREQIGLTSEPPNDALDPLARLQAIDAVLQVRRLLDALPAEQREVIMLHELSELSMHEAARELGVPLKTAFSRLYAGHRALRRALEREAQRSQQPKLRARLGVLAGFVLGMRWLPRAHALQLAAIALVCTTATVPEAHSLTLGAPDDHGSLATQRIQRRPLPLVLARAVPEAAVEPRALKRMQRAAPLTPLSEHTAAEPRRDLVVIRFDDESQRALPYAHPFEERAFSSVDPARIKPRLIHREAFCRAHAPCAL
jgi:RNA polymerase sigma-70 factor (ECF subfamily)